jgi:DNA polymerase (family 10)
MQDFFIFMHSKCIMDNYQIADALSLLAKILDIHGENSFKTRLYSNAAFQIEKLEMQLALLQPNEIAAQRGVGAAVADKVVELLQTGKLSMLEKYIEQTPPGVIEMLNIKGIGPKKINTIWKEMGIESIGELQYACNENRLTMYKGFGEKTQQNVSDSIIFYFNQQGFFLYQQAEDIANQIVSYLLKHVSNNQKICITGDMRRQMEVLETIHILTTASMEEVQEALSFFDMLDLESAEDNLLQYAITSGPTLLVQCCDAENWGWQLLETTGNDDFVTALQNREMQQADGSDEEKIFEAAGLSFIAPALRDIPNIISIAESNELTTVIEHTDIKGIIHSHSKWSDGSNSIAEMAQAAKDLRLEYLVISDHSKSAAYANGLSEERIKLQHAEIEQLNKKLAPFKIFKSIECDILGDGTLDYSNEILETFDLVIASVHSNLKMTEEKAMQRILNAVANPYVHILGHMTGRLLLSRAGYPVDHAKVIEACARHHVVIELNAHPRRLDVDWRWIPLLIEKGVLVSINPDAHSTDGFADTKYGILAAQKGMLSKENNVSSFSLAQFEAWLAQVKKLKSLAG